MDLRVLVVCPDQDSANLLSLVLARNGDCDRTRAFDCSWIGPAE